MLGAVGQRIAVAEHEARVAVVDAVVELVVREPPRERHEDDARPLRGPVEERRLEAVVEHDGEALAGREPEPACDPPHARQQVPVGEPRERLELGMPFGGREQALGEVHCPAASSIAATIGS